MGGRGAADALASSRYVPELVLGHVLTGSNFDDDAGQLTGGRHGYGAKLTNILSGRFEVETVDSKSRKYSCRTLDV